MASLLTLAFLAALAGAAYLGGRLGARIERKRAARVQRALREEGAELAAQLAEARAVNRALRRTSTRWRDLGQRQAARLRQGATS
jgi:hypothetical protein